MDIKLNMYEKYQILQNRIGCLNVLAHHFAGENPPASMFGVDAKPDRSYYGVTDTRPVSEIIEEAEALWSELKEEYKKVPDDV